MTSVFIRDRRGVHAETQGEGKVKVEAEIRVNKGPSPGHKVLPATSQERDTDSSSEVQREPALPQLDF